MKINEYYPIEKVLILPESKLFRNSKILHFAGIKSEIHLCQVRLWPTSWQHLMISNVIEPKWFWGHEWTETSLVLNDNECESCLSRMQIALNENMLIELFNSKKVNPLIVYQITYLSICFTTTSIMVRMACTLCNPKVLG